MAADGDQAMVDGMMDGVDTMVDCADPMVVGDEDMSNNRPKVTSCSSKSSKKKLKRGRPSISVIHDHSAEDSTGSSYLKNTSSSSHSSFSSTGSLGNRNSRHRRKFIPCTVVLDLIE